MNEPFDVVYVTKISCLFYLFTLSQFVKFLSFGASFDQTLECSVR